MRLPMYILKYFDGPFSLFFLVHNMLLGNMIEKIEVNLIAWICYGGGMYS